MESDRFDSLTRSLTTTGSRRRALAGLVAGALGGALDPLGSRPDEAAAKKKPCPPCKKRKQGKCKKKLPDGTACAGGTCQGGTCVAGGTGGGSNTPPPSCPTGMAFCGETCIDVTSDPRNCGSCGKRCSINATCSGGTCACNRGPGCANSEATCCASAGICACFGAPHYFLDPRTCEPVSSCPSGLTPCSGPRCRACCPAGSTCDTSTGACVQ